MLFTKILQIFKGEGNAINHGAHEEHKCIFWLVLNKRGNSSTRERTALIQRFISVFGKENIAGVMGGREFVGKDWFEYLKKCELSFYFRIKKDAVTTNAGGKDISVYYLFYGLKPHEPRLIQKGKPIYGHKLFVTGMRIDNDYLIIVTNVKPNETQPEQAIKLYAIRWEIETLFGCLKSKGFNFEDTHIVNRDRIKKVIAVLAIAYCWAYLTGEWRHQCEKTIRLKKHGRPQYSLFRYGLDWIMTALLQRGQKLRRLATLFEKIIAKPLLTNAPAVTH